MQNNIKKIRKQKKISVVELARMINMSQSNLTKIENNQVALKTDVANLIAAALEVSINDLLPLNDDNTQRKLRLINPQDKQNEYLNLPSFMVADKTTAVFSATEDCAPLIQKNDLLLVDERVNTYVADGIYLLFSNNGYYVRRLQNGFDGSVLILGSSPLSAPLKLDTNYCQIRAGVIGVLHATRL